MRIQILSSCAGAAARDEQFLMSVLIDDQLVIDAGCIGLVSPLQMQRSVRHVFLSHVHMDHIASLPSFLENVYRPGEPCPDVYAGPDVLEALDRHIFNDVLWPDLKRLSAAGYTLANFHRLESLVPVELPRWQVTPVWLRHVVPTMGFLVDDGQSAVAFISDTAPSEEVWQLVNRSVRLKAVFLEASFPNRLQWLAEKSMHLTPQLMDLELRKLAHQVPVFVVHVKAAFLDEIRAEICELNLPHVQLGGPNTCYTF